MHITVHDSLVCFIYRSFVSLHATQVLSVRIYLSSLYIHLSLYLLICLCAPQKTFGKDGVQFNGRFDDVPRLPNTCNVSILGAGLTGLSLRCIVTL
jgi:hypothetical protein